MKRLPPRLQYTCSRLISTASENDFFGIYHITNKDIAGAFKSHTKLPQEKLNVKYRPLTLKRQELANKEIEKDLSYGSIRMDSDNVPRSHGQYEISNETLLYETTDVKQMFVPNDYDESSSVDKLPSLPEEKPIDVEDIPNAKPAYNIAETKPVISLNEVINLFRRSDQITDVTKYAGKPPLTFYFDADKTTDTPRELNLAGSSPKTNLNATIIESSEAIVMPPVMNEKWEEEDAASGGRGTSLDLEEFEKEQLSSRSEMNEPEENLEEEIEFNKELDEKYDVKKDKKQKPQNALDYLKQVRERKIEPTSKGLKHRMQQDCSLTKSAVKLDSIGFRNYTNQVIDWTKLRRADAVKILRESIIYNNYDIVAINKPYGISSHVGDKQASVFNADDLMQEVAQTLRLNKLHLAHRLDKTTTGVLLFASSESMAAKLNKLFKSGQIIKTYWCLTRGLPDPVEGIIDIPIGEFTVGHKARSCLVPENYAPKNQLAKRYREARRAITEYHTINAQKSVALVEVIPKTGVKHQIRCHLGFGINTPIIGDHKYTEVGRVVPQKLPEDVLKSLQLRQAKVRTLPLHLHAKRAVIPGAKANGQTLFIHAALPDFFVENMKSLNLYSNQVQAQTVK